MNWGHGFLPRIHAGNYRAVDRSLEPPTLDGSNLELPWAIVEAPWATKEPPLLSHLREYGTQLLVDTQAWRYREPATFSVEKFSAMTIAPNGPLEGLPEAALKDFVRSDLQLQEELGADAYIVPGCIPRGRGGDTLKLTITSLQTALDFVGNGVKPQPLVGFAGVHTSDLDSAYRLLDELPYSLEALYVQVTPTSPISDSPSKIVNIASYLIACGKKGFDVIGGRLGAVGQLLRSVGIAAVDAGFGTGETFNMNSVVRPAQNSSGMGQGIPIGPRIYVPQLMRSFLGREWLRFAHLPSVKGQLTCSLPCCRFRTFGETLKRAPEHSLRWRTFEASRLAALPRTMRARSVWEDLLKTRALVTLINTALTESGERPLPHKHVENHISVLARLLREPEAA